MEYLIDRLAFWIDIVGDYLSGAESGGGLREVVSGLLSRDRLKGDVCNASEFRAVSMSAGL